AVVQHAYRTEVQADGNRSAEELSYLLRRGRGREIPIEMWVAEQRVSHGSANAPGLEPGCFEPFCKGPNGDRRIYHCPMPPRRCRADSPVSFVSVGGYDIPSQCRRPDIFRPCHSTPKS